MKIDGYELLSPLGHGGAGTIWKVRDGRGRVWAAKVLPLEAAARADRFARARVCAIATLAPADLGRIAVISSLVAGEDIATLARREGWAREHGIDVVHQVACQLARIHAAGLAHGDLTAANIHATTSSVVVLDPLLGEEKTTPHIRPPEGGPPTPAGDVYALGMLARDLGVRHPLLEQACARAPDKRPAARHLARALHPGRTRRPREPHLLAPAPAEGDPIRCELARGDDERTCAPRRPGPGTPARRHGRGRVSIVVGAGLAVAGIVSVVVPELADVAGGATPAPAASASVGPARGQERDIAAHVRHLVDARDGALASGDKAALAAVSKPGSPARAEDEALYAHLKAAGVRISGLRTTVSDVLIDHRDSETVTVSARLRQHAYRRCRAAACTTVPAQPPRTVRISLDGPHGVVVALAATR